MIIGKERLLNSNYRSHDFTWKATKHTIVKFLKIRIFFGHKAVVKMSYARQVSKIQKEKIQLIHSMSIVESFILGIDILLLFSFHSIPASSHLINDLALMEFTFQHSTAVSKYIVDNDLILIFMSYTIRKMINSSINYCPIVKNIHIWLEIHISSWMHGNTNTPDPQNNVLFASVLASN